MFKKIEVWILYLVVLLGIPLTIGFGALVRHEALGGKKLSVISKPALFLAEIPANIKKILINKHFLAQDRFPSLGGFSGNPNSHETYLLLSRHDGDLGAGIVELVDLTNFKVLHTWNPDIDEFNKSVEKISEFKHLSRDKNQSRYLLRHPKLDKHGGLIFKDHSPLIKIDACSNLIFQNTHDLFHHSIETDHDGNIWVPSHSYPQTLPIFKVGRDIPSEEGYLDDSIVKLSPNGEILFEKSVSQIFIDNSLEYLLFSAGNSKFSNDPIHLNDIQPVNFDGKFWKKGDLFLSIRHQSMVLLYRPATNKIIWKGTGPFFHQHDVDVLNNHTISIFNNNSKDFVDGDIVDGNNEVIIYDFRANKYSPYQNKGLIKNDVRTTTQGRSQILPNNDLFIEETDYGRILYFGADNSLIWTYVNRAGNQKVYQLSWSRIMYTDDDVKIVKNFMESRGKCNN
ncbi:arylsulfotransferase family protein [Synechococcus sp. UW105]|uniref:arylsulfotransferase family protein n=1 Tax=Synechococcus sp. UW105 TaxID=337067 RepID=UPI001482F409|nr:arylsulfotransferase family protein [Synechococcus sp. UW105]